MAGHTITVLSSPGCQQRHFLLGSASCIAGGKIYVTDFGNPGIKIFTMEGKYISTVGSLGRRFGQFVRPKGIAVDRDLNLYVVDSAFENVQIFNKEGDLLMFFGGTYKGLGDM